MKVKTIVALVDFAEGMNSVIDCAKEAALAFRSKLVLLHVLTFQPSIPSRGVEFPMKFLQPTDEERNAHRKRLARICKRLDEQGVQVIVEQLQGIPIEKILHECQSLHADLIVMGTHHHSLLHQLLHGSMSHEVLSHSDCPMLIVPLKM